MKVAAKPTGPETEQPPVWLVMEWPEGEDAPTKYFLTTLPARMTKKEIVRIIKEREREARRAPPLTAAAALHADQLPEMPLLRRRRNAAPVTAM